MNNQILQVKDTAPVYTLPEGHNLPSNWQVIKLGELEEKELLWMRNGFPCGTNNEDEKGIPQLRPMNIDNSGSISLASLKFIETEKDIAGYLVRMDDVIFNNTNSRELVGKTALWQLEANSYVLSNHMTILRFGAESDIDPYFFARYFHFLWLNKYFEQIRRQHVNQASISLQRLREVQIPHPPLPEQHAIARALRVLEEAKEARQREVTLERERKATLMQHLFTYGTRGETTKQTEIGEIPESWRIEKLGKVVTVVSGGTPDRSKSEFWNGNIPWVKTGEINYDTISSTEEAITQYGLDKSSARIIPNGTILMAMYGQGVTRGRVAILGIDAAINQACAALLLSGGASTKFLFYFLTYIYERIRNLGHGANQKNLNAALIKSIPIILPLLTEQHKIANVLQACDTTIFALEKEASLLDELFQAMLEELMTGRLSAVPLIDSGKNL